MNARKHWRTQIQMQHYTIWVDTGEWDINLPNIFDELINSVHLHLLLLLLLLLLPPLQLISHKQPVVAVLYNPLFERVVTTGADSVVAVWAVTDGQKDIQYRVNVDSEGEYNVDESLTAMCFDSTYRRLITGGMSACLFFKHRLQIKKW